MIRLNLFFRTWVIPLSLVSSNLFATPPDPTDWTLRLWLRGETLDGNDNGLVEAWIDSSSYGTKLAPRKGKDESPSYAEELFPGNPNSMPVVRFDVAGPPSPGNQDRLFQVSDTDPFDPLDIGNGHGLTIIVVYKPFVTETPALGYQTILGKRGLTESVYTFGIHGIDDEFLGQLNFIQYDAITEYRSEDAIYENRWHVSMVQVDERGLDDTVQFFDDDTEDPEEFMWPISIPMNIINRNNTVPEPFALGGHSQPCCGDGERFAGFIAEVIIYSRKIKEQELEELESYLNTKYFTTNQPPTDLISNRSADGGTVDLEWSNNANYDSIVIRRNGEKLIELAGDKTSFRDTLVPDGKHIYAVVAGLEGFFEGPKCTVVEPPPADKEPPTVRISRDESGNIVIEWTGILETSKKINATWAKIDAKSPLLLIPENFAQQQYFRALQQ